MTDTTENPMDRLHELMGAAAFDALNASESAELERLLAADPQARRELEEMRATLALLPSAGSGAALDVQPSAGLEERIVAAAGGLPPPPMLVTGPAPSRKRAMTWVAAAAAAVVIAGLGGWAIGQREPAGPTGPPGTLGATEPIAFTGEPRGVAVDASVVAHTWGTETVMTIDGLEQGTYMVEVVDNAGARVDSGTFIAPPQGITECRMIVGLLREEARTIVVSSSDGDTVMRSRLPQAST